MSKPVGRYRELMGIHKWYFRGFTAFAAILSFVHVFKFVIFGYVMQDMSYFAVLIAAFVSAVFLLFPATGKAPRDRVPWYDSLLAAASLIGPLYVFTHNLDIILGGWEVVPPLPAKIVAFITWALIIESVRRTGGAVLAGVILLISLYPLFAHLCPGILMAKQYSLARILGFHFLGMQSIFGLPTQVFSRLLIGYMIFAVYPGRRKGGRSQGIYSLKRLFRHHVRQRYRQCSHHRCRYHPHHETPGLSALLCRSH